MAHLLYKPPARGSKTHAGVAGKDNQDSFALFRIGPGDPDEWYAYAPESTFVAAVADGVTSQTAGASASRIAVRALQRSLRQPEKNLTTMQRLNDAFRTANQAILDAVDQNANLAGMSTTLVAALIEGQQLHIAHTGDSRAYLIRGEAIYQLTVDHTWVQQAVDAGRLTADEARFHANRHTLVHYLGMRRGLHVDHGIVQPANAGDIQMRTLVQSLPLQPGDSILLCSDGATDKLDPEEICKIAARHRYQPKRATRSLVNTAVARHESDNITAVMLTIPPSGRLRDILTYSRYGMGHALTVGLFATIVGLWLLLRIADLPWQANAGERVAAAVPITPLVMETNTRQIRVGDLSLDIYTASTPLSTPAILSQPQTDERDGFLTPVTQTVHNVRPFIANTPVQPPLGPVAAANIVRSAATSTPTSRPTSTRLATMTRTRPIPRATPQPSPPTATPLPIEESVAALPAEVTNWTVTLDVPFEKSLQGRQVFRWIPNFELPDEYLFEVVFWEREQEPLLSGFSPYGASSATAVAINLDKASDFLSEFQPGREYVWGVLLVDAKNPLRRIRSLANGRPFVLAVDAGEGENAPNDSGTSGE